MAKSPQQREEAREQRREGRVLPDLSKPADPQVPVNGDDDDSEEGRKGISYGRMLDKDGNVTKDELVAEGFEYELKNGRGKVRHMVTAFPENIRNALAVKGALSEARGVINSAFPKSKRAEGVELEISPVEEFFRRALAGEWGLDRERGSRLQVARLVEAVTNVAAKAGKTATTIVAKINSDADFAQQLYQGNADVRLEYQRLTTLANMKEETISTESLFD